MLMINKVWICTTHCSINCETNVGFKLKKKKLIKIISEDLANIDQNLLDAEINSCRKLNFFQASVQCIRSTFPYCSKHS